MKFIFHNFYSITYNCRILNLKLIFMREIQIDFSPQKLTLVDCSQMWGPSHLRTQIKLKFCKCVDWRLISVEITVNFCRFDLCVDDKGEHSPVENLGQVVFGERIRPSPYKVITSLYINKTSFSVYWIICVNQVFVSYVVARRKNVSSLIYFAFLSYYWSHWWWKNVFL